MDKTEQFAVTQNNRIVATFETRKEANGIVRDLTAQLRDVGDDAVLAVVPVTIERR